MGYKIKNFSSIILNGEEYKLSGSKKAGADSVYDLKKADEKNAEYVIKIHTKEENIDRFENEIKYLKECESKLIIDIVSDGIISYYDQNDLSLSRDYRYFIMPKMSSSFKEVINSQISYKDKLKLFLDVCYAVSFIHKKGIIHRDIKPENILFDEINKMAKLCDFGIAKFPDLNITENGDRLANANYCAPEQRQKNGNVGPYSDIYSLGLILNEIFTKSLITGTEYKKIVEVCPSFGELDEIVYDMTQTDYKKREKSIDIIIYKIEEYLKRRRRRLSFYKKKNLSIKNTAKEKRIIDMFAEDSFALDYLASKEVFLNQLHLNYHRNIHCKIRHKNLKRELCLAKIEKLVASYYHYESSAPLIIDIFDKEKWGPVTKEQCDMFYEIIFPYADLKIKEYGNAIHMFAGLRDYHATELLKKIDSEIEKLTNDLDDSPICYLVKIIKDFFPDSIFHNFGSRIEPILNKSDDEPLDNDIFTYDNKEYESIEEKMKEFLINSSISFSINENYIIFDNEDYKIFKNKCNEYADSLDSSNLIAVDIEDMLNELVVRKNKKVLYLSNYAVKFLLTKIFNLGITPSF